jgi:acyl-CoA thioester hydrolase
MYSKTLCRDEPAAVDNMTVEINDADLFKYKTTIETRFGDFDLMGHVNNAVYFSYMEIGRVKYWKQAIRWDWKKTGVVIGNASIKYIVPIHLDDTIQMYVRTSRIGNSSFDLQYLIVKVKHGKETVCSKGTTTCVAFDYALKKATPIPAQERAKMIAFEQLDVL